MDKTARKFLFVVVAGLALFFVSHYSNQTTPGQYRLSGSIVQSAPPQTQPAAAPVIPLPSPIPARSSGVIENAFRNRAGNLPVTESGVVSRILPDDTQGARHQRFIVSLASGHTILIAHNIDIAPRINDLREGNSLTFCGVYEWNDKGGVVHWTHHDPSGRYGGGYLLHNGNYYR